jgi:hypothetical protein
MDTLPPKVERKLVRTRSFRLGPDGVTVLLRELRRERLTGEVVVNMSQGGLGPVVVRDSQDIPEPEGT